MTASKSLLNPIACENGEPDSFHEKPIDAERKPKRMTSKNVTLDHGSGGEASRELVETIFLNRLHNEYLALMDDSAVLPVPGKRLAMTTDSYVIDPVFFPGGNIGSLSVHGTVNDLAMQGARPLYLTLGLILEEGFPLKQLEKIIDSVAYAASEAGIKVVTGDTKVVPKGHADKIFINTSGIGVISEGIDVSCRNARPGDRVIISGNIGDHGIAVLTSREGLQFKTPILSDSAPLNGLTESILCTTRQVHVLRDPTRGGVATALNEIAGQSGVGIRLFEEDLPISPAVAAAAEVLGMDPLYLANEGKCLVIANPADTKQILKIMQNHPYGQNSRVIGEVINEDKERVILKTQVGGARILGMLTGEQLPRIC